MRPILSPVGNEVLWNHRLRDGGPGHKISLHEQSQTEGGGLVSVEPRVSLAATAARFTSAVFAGGHTLHTGRYDCPECGVSLLLQPGGDGLRQVDAHRLACLLSSVTLRIP